MKPALIKMTILFTLLTPAWDGVTGVENPEQKPLSQISFFVA